MSTGDIDHMQEQQREMEQEFPKVPGQLILSCFVAGTPHRIVEGLDINNVQVDDEVIFEPDPSNQFDPDAIKVLHTGRSLGFIPREQTPIIHETIAKGQKVTAKVVARGYAKFKEIIIQARLV